MILAGQIMGWVAAILTFLSYQCKKHKTLLVVQTFATLSICISYMFLNAWSGMLTNAICIIRNFIIFRKDIKFFSHKSWPYILAGAMAIGGATSWQGPASLLIILALVINTLFMYFPNVQNLRKSILLTCSMIMLYNIHYRVWGGVANELIGITSAIIGLYRFRQTKA